MLQFMTAKEAALKWDISQRRVSVLCSENRIFNAAMLGNMWIIPIDAKKPADARMQRNQNTITTHPFVKWAGGKGQSLEVLHENLPKDIASMTKYIEPFVGGGALLFSLINKYSFEEIYISDNNKELINCYKVIKDNCSELIYELKSLQKVYEGLSIEEQQLFFYKKREEYNELVLNESTKIQKSAMFIFLNKTCFNGLYRVNKHGKFNVPCGKYKNPLICDESNLRSISNKLQNITIHYGDYKDCLEIVDENTFVYFDPPYRPLNNTSNFTSYTEDCFNDKNQIELANFYKELSKKGAKLMLSNSDPKNTKTDDNFFDDLYNGFNIQRINALRMINSKSDKRGNITELLIKNY